MADSKPHVEEAPDPAAYIQFASHNDAYKALESVGYSCVAQRTPFGSSDLCEQVNSLLKDDAVCVMDMTTAIPDTCHAAYQALTVAGFTASSACKKDNNAAFLMLRTESNTPSFLMGHHWGCVQAIGKDAAEAHIRQSSTPCLVVIFRDRQFYVPASVCSAGLQITAELVAHELTINPKFMSCCMCNKSFVERGAGDCVNIGEMGVGPDGRKFRRECVLKYAEEHGREELKRVYGL